MKIVSLKNKYQEILKAAARELRAGAVAVYPTDTAYGMGADATDGKAVARVFRIKGRPTRKGLPVICSDLAMVKKFFLLAGENARLAKKYWPGPLSLVLHAKGKIAAGILEKGTVAVRVPALPAARALAKLVGRPLAATSANLSGQAASYSARAFLKQAAGKKTLPDLVLDAGALRKKKPSTIARVSKDGRVEILRAGPVRLKMG